MSKLNGGCLCGAVRYTTNAVPEFVGLSMVLPMGVEPTTAILETAALLLSYGSPRRAIGVSFFSEFFNS